MIMTSFVLGACSSPDISDDDVQDEDDIVSDYQKELGMEDITYESGNEITFTEM